MDFQRKGAKTQRRKVLFFVSFTSFILCVFVFLFAGCAPGGGTSILPTLAATAVVAPPEKANQLNVMLPVTYTPVSAGFGVQPVPVTPAPPAPAVAATPTIGPSPTHYAYAGLTIDELRERPFGGGVLQTHEVMTTGPNFTRHLISYPSDGLTIYGFMNTPPDPGPLPVVLVLHGFVEPEDYTVTAYTTPYADELAKDGFLVIHPNYRNHPPSDNGDNLFRVGYAVDVLNLISIIRAQAGQPGPLQNTDPNRIYLFGHSMGGGIALRVLTVSPHIRAAALYGSMSGDEQRNFEKIALWSNGRSGAEERQAAAADLQRISPGNYLQNITAPLSIHHGTADAVTPPEWSYQLCEQLQTLGNEVNCYRYPGEPHNFTAAGQRLLMNRVSAFFTETGEEVEVSR